MTSEVSYVCPFDGDELDTAVDMIVDYGTWTDPDDPEVELPSALETWLGPETTVGDLASTLAALGGRTAPDMEDADRVMSTEELRAATEDDDVEDDDVEDTDQVRSKEDATGDYGESVKVRKRKMMPVNMLAKTKDEAPHRAGMSLSLRVSS